MNAALLITNIILIGLLMYAFWENLAIKRQMDELLVRVAALDTALTVEPPKAKVACGHCGKKIVPEGLAQHQLAMHSFVKS